MKPVSIYPGEKMGSVIHIVWMLHNLCNHRCSYCDEMNYNGDARWLKYDQVVAFLEKVFAHYKKDLYHVSFTGGEPTLWPEFGKLCAYLRSKGCEIGLTSNGTRPIEFWKTVVQDLNWVCLSYHPEFTRDEHFVRVTNLVSQTTQASVRLMMAKDPAMWKRSIDMGEKLKKLSDSPWLHVEYVPLQENFGNESFPMIYEPWQQELFSQAAFFSLSNGKEVQRKEGFRNVWDYKMKYADGSVELCRPNELVAQNQVNFEGWTCYTGIDSLFIDHLGEVVRSGCRQGGKIGHIFDENIRFPEQSLKCAKNFCPCGSDIQIRKNAN